MWWRLQLALPAEQREVDEGFRRDAGSESGERRWMRELFQGYTYTVEESEVVKPRWWGKERHFH